MAGTDGEQRENTDFYYAFCCAFAALLLFATPWFFSFGDFPWRPLGVPVGRILSVLCYAAGVFVAIFVLTFARAGFQKHPELRSLFPTPLRSENAWQGLFGAATFLFLGAGVYWIAFSVAEAAGFVAVLVKLFVYLMLLFTIVQLAQALDGFVVRPLIESASRGEDEREALAKRVRQVGALIAAVLDVVAALATVYDVTLK